MTRNIWRSRFYPVLVFSYIRALDFNFDSFLVSSLRDGKPMVACKQNRIDRIGNDSSSNKEIVFSNGISYPVTSDVHRPYQ